MKTQSKPRNKLRTILCTVTLLICILSLATISILYAKNITPQQLLSSIGIIPEQKVTNYTLLSWENSLKQLQYDADIVFIGDSLTNGENFQEYYKNQKILNLGLSGDSLQGIHKRSAIISHFAPKKIFIQGGINNLAGDNIDNLIKLYDAMINEIVANNPSAKIYIQGILPISNAKQTKGRTNENICKLNKQLCSIADKYKLTYIDLFPLYELSGEMNPEYTTDGIHLKDEYKYLWLEALYQYINN